MRRHDQTNRRAPNRAWSGFILVCTLAATAVPVSSTTRGQDASGAATLPPGAGDPIDLVADRVRVWDERSVRWVHLAGRAAVLQGAEGLRAREALVRIASVDRPGGPDHVLEVHAETLMGADGHPASGSSLRTSFRTHGEVRVRSYEASGLSRSGGPPVGLSILARSGLVVPREDPSATPATRRTPPALRVASYGRAPEANPPGTPGGSPVGGPPEPAVAAMAPMAPVVVPPTRSGPAPEAIADAAAGPLVLPGASPPRRDPAVTRTQFAPSMDGVDGATGPEEGLPSAIESPPLDGSPVVPALPDDEGPSTTLEALPGPDGGPAPPSAPPGAQAAPVDPTQPIVPGTQRVTRIFPRNGSGGFDPRRLPVADGVETIIVRGGVNIVSEAPQFGLLDIAADSAIIWRRTGPDGQGATTGPNGEMIEDANLPLEFYLEGDVIVRQDERKVAGNGDQKTFRAKQAYFDVLSQRFIGLDAEANMFAPGLIAPARVVSPRIEQFRPLTVGPDGRGVFGLAELRADQTMGTGSRFPNPGYRFTSRSVDVYRIETNETEPNSGRPAGDPANPDAPRDLSWRIDARQNVFWLGPVPVFYWPRFAADAEDLEPPLRQINFRTNNYFGQQLLTDWNGFRLFGLQKPKYIDVWNIDLDYLSARTKSFPALGTEIGWFGRDLINDVTDPYGRQRGRAPSWTNDYFGYFDIWGLRDYGRDTLGSGPAVITNNIAAGNVGYQRGGGGPLGAVPPFQDFRGRVLARHMQRFLPDDDAHLYEDFRAQLEFGYISDRHFLEQYYKRLNDVGMDQETLFYLIRQRENHAWTILAEPNLQNWYTDTQWLPRLEYFRLGDSLLSNWFTYFQHSGVNYANTHTAVEVNNPYIFAFLPYDPISNTSGVFQSFRAYTNHEVDMPLNFWNLFTVVPYVQGQGVGWTEQIDGTSMGRVWGAAGSRATVMAWKAYPWVESEVLNIHGLNHKINLEADFRTAWANQRLDWIGVQDDLDDNTYEFVRRYFGLTNYAGGLLPPQYDPRHLVLRQTLSPITGTTDVQNTLNTLHLGLHQRLQTKRGPEGRQRIIDYMTFDLDTTFFPNPSRDNFGVPFGQNMYNWQWFIGDRTSILSTGWFEFWDIGGHPIYKTNIDHHNDPFGLNVITTGVSLSRPPRGNVFLGYTVIDTGPINTSALNVSSTYWLSPKWYGTFSTMYDFGNAILLNSMFSLTRIGADYLMSLGLNVDPQRQSYMFAFMLSPRLSPTVRLGSGVGLNTFDSRYAPTQ